jgi:hypothetical protein
MRRLKLIYHGPNNYQVIDLDTGRDLCKDNDIQRIKIDMEHDSLPVITFEIRPLETQIILDGHVMVKTRRAKLK